MSRTRPLGFLFLFASLASAQADDRPPVARKVDFASDVRPILDRSCSRCHGVKAKKGGLSFATRDDALKGGDNGPAIVPGRGLESRLIQYVGGEDDLVMPPDGSGEPLTPEQVGLLRAWIDQGANWPEGEGSKGAAKADHWAFRPPVRPPVPSVRDRAWVRNPVDAFVLARMEKEGLAPSPEAGRATLLRRLSLDLIGLPPTIGEIDAFLADRSPDAYEKQVDRLLASPHYGERWARRWLDRARYADTNGYEKDRERSIWPYRDWVIDALNRDMPFDRFTVEQLAGDLLPDATAAQKVATGFHRNTMINEEGGIDVEEFRFAAVVDRVATTGSVWLGLTIQCAQCHTHKYDPITQREYYRLFAFLNNADEPDLPLPTPDVESRRASIEAEAVALERTRADAFPSHNESLDWTISTLKRMESTSGTTLDSRPGGLVVATGRPVESDSYRLEFVLPPGRYTGLRLDTLADPKAAEPGPGRTSHGNFVVSEFRARLVPDDKAPAAPIPFAGAHADVEQSTFEASKAIDGDPKTGWAVDDGSGRIREPHSATFALKEPIESDRPIRLAIEIDQNHGGHHTLGRFRVAARRDRGSVVGPPLPEAVERRRHLEVRQAEWEGNRATADWSIAGPVRLSSRGHATLDLRPDLSVLARGDKPNNDVYEVDLEGDLVGTTGLRLEVLPDPSLPDDGPGRAPLFSVGDFILTEIAVATVDGPAARPVPLASASEDYSEPGHPAAMAIDGASDTGWTVKGGVGRPHAAVFAFKEPIAAGTGKTLRVTLRQEGIHQTTIGRFRLSTTRAKSLVASGLPDAIERTIRVPAKSRTAEQRAAIRDHFLSVAPELAKLNRRIADLRGSKPRPSTTMVMEERRPSEARTTHIHRRGEFLQPGEAVGPGVPAVLPPLPSDAPKDRLGLARWIVAEENPLTARVFVNQAWQAFFGRGIVATVDDFGTRGEPPSHLELLDWLATEAVRLGWSPKALHRLIVTSATYRQSSKVSPDRLARDPQNLSLTRGPRFRVEAEAVRDIALALSGLLNPKLGGPSVYPPQPEGVTSLAYGQAEWPTSRGPDRYRRGLYTFTKRAAPYAAFGLFDAPSSESTCTRRERSNSPLQALTLLNDPVYQEAARALADRVLREAPATTEGRIRHAFRLCLSRSPEADESAMIVAYLDRQLSRARAGELPGPLERTAWTAVARVLLNLDETITKE